MYKTLRLSTVRFVRDVIAMIPPSPFDIQYMDWDAHAETQELPQADLIGPIGFAVTQEGQMHDMTFGIGLVTLADPNIFRLTDYTDIFYTRARAHENFTVYHPVTLQRLGIATFFDGTSVTPITRAEIRPAQSLQVTARFVPDGLDA